MPVPNVLAVTDGVNEIISQPDKVKKFKEIQKNYFKNTPNYVGYGRDGIKVLFSKCPAGIFSNRTAVPPDMTLKFDSIVMLQIYNNYKGKALVSGIFPWRFDYTGILMMLVSILALWYGLESVRCRGYLKYLSSLGAGKNIYKAVVISRLLLFTFVFLAINIILYIFIRIRGIQFTGPEHGVLLWQLLVSLVILGSFFFLGVIIGTLSSGGFSYLFIFLTWFVIIFATPITIGAMAEYFFPDANKDYQTELDNFETVVEFEERVTKESGNFNRDNIKVARSIIEKYWNNDYKRIQAHESELRSEIEADINTLGKLSIFFPMLFYKNTGSEVGSRGFLNYLNFYEYSQQMKARFVRFYIDRTYYNDPKDLVPFITGDENIFKAVSQLPRYFFIGLIIHFFYFFILFFISCFAFNRKVFPLPKKAESFNELELDLKSNKKITISLNQVEFLDQFINMFLNRCKRLPWKVILDDENISGGFTKQCVVLPNPGEIPGDIKGIYLLSLFKSMYRISNEDFSEILAGFEKEELKKRFKILSPFIKARFLLKLACINIPSVYILNDFVFGIDYDEREKLKYILDTYLEKNKILIDITTHGVYWISGLETQVFIIQKNGKYHAKMQPFFSGLKDENRK